MLRIGLHLDTDTHTDTSYEADPLPRSPIGSDAVCMKGKRISHPTLNR